MATKKEKKLSGLRPHRNTGPKIKRNQPCPCGSGVKAKRCCLKHVQAIAALPERERESFLVASILQQAPIGDFEEPTITEPDVEVADCQLEIKSAE